MIKITESTTEAEGTSAVLMSELTYAIYHITNEISQNDGIPLAQVEEDLMNSVKIIRLTESGMDMHEAHRIVMGDRKLLEPKE